MRQTFSITFMSGLLAGHSNGFSNFRSAGFGTGLSRARGDGGRVRLVRRLFRGASKSRKSKFRVVHTSRSDAHTRGTLLPPLFMRERQIKVSIQQSWCHCQWLVALSAFARMAMHFRTLLWHSRWFKIDLLLQVEKQRRWLYGFSDATKNELPFQGQKSYDINSKCGMWSCFMRVFNAIKLFCSSSERRVVVKNVAARDLTLQHSLLLFQIWWAAFLFCTVS